MSMEQVMKFVCIAEIEKKEYRKCCLLENRIKSEGFTSVNYSKETYVFQNYLKFI